MHNIDNIFIVTNNNGFIYFPFISVSFLAELLLWYLTGNILGVEVSCG